MGFSGSGRHLPGVISHRLIDGALIEHSEGFRRVIRAIVRGERDVEEGHGPDGMPHIINYGTGDPSEAWQWLTVSPSRGEIQMGQYGKQWGWFDSNRPFGDP